MVRNLELLVNGMRGKVIYTLFDGHPIRKLLEAQTLLTRGKLRHCHLFPGNLYLYFQSISHKDILSKSNINCNLGELSSVH